MPVLNEEKIESFFDDAVDQAPLDPGDDLAVAEAEDEEGQLSVDVSEDDDNYYIRALLAAVKPEDLDVSYSDSLLTIRGKRSQKREVEEKNYLYKECFWGSFSRSIGLPAPVKADAIEASLKNGVLTVILPKI